MKRLKRSLILCVFALTLVYCKTHKNYDIKASGVIQESGITSYQYGTHTLEGDTFYALKSDSINLNDYVGKSVTVEGQSISGYPVDGGPEYLLVLTITED
ncbi:hypothetical protein [Hanstruepera marina]|uniref:hypothetical protein n=1 Tax=Hanstruepera marina TaxID=2873265 RepID=UPI001CA74BAC|nr:hypothetical protein [Hanstruepera marina]